MGCVASRLEEEEEVVSICRERKRQLKLTVERRYALADAHYRYCQSLYGVSAAIRLFVARHSSPPSPFMITFPPPTAVSSQEKDNVVSNPLFLQQTPVEPTTKESIFHCESCKSSTTESESEDEEEEEEMEMEEKVVKQNQKQEPSSSEYFYMEMPHNQPMAMPSPQMDFGWDFFNPFYTTMRSEIFNDGYNRTSEEDLKAVREKEGIPELEEEESSPVVQHLQQNVQHLQQNVQQHLKQNVQHHLKQNVQHHLKQKNDERAVEVADEREQKGLTVIDTPVRGRDLLEALGDVGDHFIRAFDSGKDVSRMLEVNRVQLQSNLEEIKENSTKMIQAITLKTSSSRSSSCKSLVASSSKSTLTFTEFKNDLFDDYGGMDSGSHSLTLGRIYAWEKKLYQEVKAGDTIRKLYERKCSQLRNQDVRGDEGISVDKTRAAVKDLYSRILVAIRSAETISQRIEKLRDEELQPQVMELLHGMMRCWNVMLESHEIQNKIMYEVKIFTCPTYGKFCNESHRLSTLQLEAELQNWRTCFKEYTASLKAYVEALHGWISKFIVPEVEFESRSRRRSSSAPSQVNGVNGPPLLIICRDWLAALDKLPDRAVSSAIRTCERDVKALWVQQGKEQNQKRRVDNLSKELDIKALAFQKAENRIYEFKISEHKEEAAMEDHRVECLKEKKDLLDNLRRKVEMEKENHQNCMQETQRITLNGFQTGFGRVFESMADFSKTAFKMCDDLISNNSNAEEIQNASRSEKGSQLEDNNS